MAYDFSAENASGVTIYYTILSNANKTVAVTYKDSKYNSYSGVVDIPEKVTNLGTSIEYTVTRINASAFRNCTGLTSVTIPSSVIEIGNQAFYGCNNSGFTSIILPESVTTIGASGTGSSDGRVFYNCTYLESINIPSGVSYIPIYAFYQCSSLSSIEIPSSVTSIGQYAFYQCSSLSSIEIPSSVTSIGQYAFSNCTNLSSVNIPSGVATITQYAFRGCSALTSIIFPASITEIQSNAFYLCTNLASVTLLRTTPPSLSSATVFQRSWTSGDYPTNFYVLKGSRDTYESAEYWSTYSSRISELSEITFDNLDLTNSVTPLTIPSDFVLTVTSTLTNPDASKLVINDGGQLICNNAVEATIQKNITHYTVVETQGETKTDGWYFIASPVNYNPAGTMLSNTYDLFLYDEAQVMWRNYEQAGAYHHFSMEPAKGYLYANSEDTDLSFAGLMPACTTNVAVDLSYSSGASMPGFNLVGNPFTNNLTSNVTIGGNPLSAYSYVEGGSEILSTTLADRTIKPAEGFLVQATGENQQLVFNPSSKGETAIKPSFIRIEAGNADFMDRAYVQIGQGNTLRKMTINDNVSHVYVMSEGKDYAAATIQEAQGEMPVNFKAAKNGQYTITVNPENVEMDYLHLVDNITGADIDLLSTPCYTFNAKTTDYATRFRLLFAANGIEENGTSTSSATFAFISNGQLVVNGTGTLQVVDMTGRVVSTKSTEERISTNELTPGVYVVKLMGNETKTQKIVIE